MTGSEEVYPDMQIDLLVFQMYKGPSLSETFVLVFSQSIQSFGKVSECNYLCSPLPDSPLCNTTKSICSTWNSFSYSVV